jgi:hypothetical protein
MRLSYHWPATVAAAYGGDMKLLGSRLDDQERAAREAGSFRREVESSWQRVGWAVGSGDIQLALKLSLVAVSKAEEFGHPQPITRARLAHCCALLLSGSVAKARAALRECLATAGPDGFLGCLLDAFALYAARENRPAQSARLLGFADACYGRIDQVRGPLEARMASEALEEISRGLDKSRIAQWRAAESGSSRPEALALAEEVLAASPPGSGPM